MQIKQITLITPKTPNWPHLPIRVKIIKYALAQEDEINYYLGVPLNLKLNGHSTDTRTLSICSTTKIQLGLLTSKSWTRKTRN